MPRPMKLRQITNVPAVTFFKPAGVPASTLEILTLTLEEMESIRLKDAEGLQQEECAKRMGVSRATFHTILKSARQKIADALLHGKAIQVEGGIFALPGGRFRCRRDGIEWNLPPGPLPGARSVSCPTCRGTEVQPVLVPHAPWCGGEGRGRRGHAWQGTWGPTSQGQRPESPRARGRGTAPTDEPIGISRQIQKRAGVNPSSVDGTMPGTPRGEGQRVENLKKEVRDAKR